MKLGRALGLGLVFASATLQGCASDPQRCGLVACGVERDALLQVTATQLTAPATALSIYDIHHYPDSTVAWRARNAGREYQCREARDAADPARVHFVYCRPAT